MAIPRSPAVSIGTANAPQNEEDLDNPNIEETPPPDDTDSESHDTAALLAHALQAIQEMQAELNQKNNRIKALEARTFQSGPARELKIKKPDVFEGKISEYNTFISQCLLTFHMCPATYGNEDEDKILFIISYLGGAPRKWAIPILEDEDHPLRKDFKAFKSALDTMYADRNVKQKARDRLSLLKQTKSVTSYSAEFQQIVAPLKLNDDDDSKFSLFYNGLH